jgi:hypothetical protein
LPTKPQSVDAFLSTLQHSRRPEIESLRRMILAGVPGLTERIKWNAPSFGRGADDRITMRLQPGDRVQLVLHGGTAKRAPDGFAFEDPTGLIEWAATDRGVISIEAGQLETIAPELTELLGRWVDATQ